VEDVAQPVQGQERVVVLEDQRQKEDLRLIEELARRGKFNLPNKFSKIVDKFIFKNLLWFF
jgi:hypothetical protein